MMPGDLMTAPRPAAGAAPRGRLGRYALWQLKDFALQRGAAMLAVAAVLAYPVIAGSHAKRWTSVRVNGVLTTQVFDPDPVQAAQNATAGVLYPVIILGALLAVRGLVSDDRQHGYHRFLFAKPISITRYYAQSYAVQFAGFLGVVGLLILLFAAFLRPLATMPGLFASAAVLFALVGSVGFLLSTVVRADWFWLLLTMGVSAAAAGFHAAGERWLAPAVVVLPPVRQLSSVMEALVDSSAALHLTDLLWVLGYGALCLVLALATLRRRALPA